MKKLVFVLLWLSSVSHSAPVPVPGVWARMMGGFECPKQDVLCVLTRLLYEEKDLTKAEQANRETFRRHLRLHDDSITLETLIRYFSRYFDAVQVDRASFEKGEEVFVLRLQNRKSGDILDIDLSALHATNLAALHAAHSLTKKHPTLETTFYRDPDDKTPREKVNYIPNEDAIRTLGSTKLYYWESKMHWTGEWRYFYLVLRPYRPDTRE